MFGQTGNLLLLALGVIWLWQLVVIFGLPEAHFRQPTDRVLWFIVVLIIPLGAVVFLLWNAGRAKLVREEQEYQAHRARLAQRLKAAPNQPSSQAATTTPDLPHEPKASAPGKAFGGH